MKKSSHKKLFDETDIILADSEEGEDLIQAQAKQKKEKFLHLISEIIVDATMEEARCLKKIEDSSDDGFHYDKEGHRCALCNEIAFGENSWYDKYGLKCMTCQDAINKKIIPASIAKDSDSYYTATGLEVSFNMTHHIISSFVKAGLLKERIIPSKSGKGKHLWLFLLKDNKDFLPPHKKLRVGGPVKEINDQGGEEYVFYPWYYFVHPIEHLAKYGISKYMRWEKEADDKNK